MVFGVKREIQKVKNGKQVVLALDFTNTLFAHSYCLFRDYLFTSLPKNTRFSCFLQVFAVDFDEFKTIGSRFATSKSKSVKMCPPKCSVMHSGAPLPPPKVN